MDESPSIFSKQHPFNLAFRSILLVAGSPVLVWIAWNKHQAGESDTALIAGVFAVLFLLIGGLHLYSVFGRRLAG